MKKANILSYLIYLILFAYLCLSFILLIPNFKVEYYQYINPIFWITLFVISRILFRNDYCKKKYKYDYIQIVSISIIVYLIIFYLSGLITGFLTLPFSHKITAILINIWSYVLVLGLGEYIRQILINRSGNNKLLLITIMVIFAAFNIINLTSGMNIQDVSDIFKLIFTIIIAEIAKSSLLTYLTYKSDYIPSLLYVIILELIIYVIPITPDLNWFLEGSFKLLLPFSIFMVCNNFDLRKSPIREKRKRMYLNLTPLLIVIIPLIILVSGIFKYQIIGIISNSMVPTYRRGDAIIFEKLNDKEKDDLKKGNIIVFQKDKTYIIHRIEKIEVTPAGNRKYVTKGDNNDDIDTGFITNEDIIGEYKLKIYKIGYPSVWLQELINKKG